MTLEKKNKLLAFSLMAMSLSIIVVLYLGGERAADVDTELFKVQNGEKIERVLLQSGEDTVDLKYNGSAWVVNEKFSTDINMIKVLIATLLQHEPKRPVATLLKDSIASALEKEGVHVTVFADGNTIKDFYAGGNKAKTQAYFMDADSREVYLMVIPGYRVYVSGVYELDESGFRDKYVFGFRWQNFKGLRATFPGKPSQDFNVVLDAKKQFFTIDGMPKVDTARLNAFLTDVSLLTVDRYAKHGEPADTAAANKIMEIVIEDVAQRKYGLKLFSGQKNNMITGVAGNAVAYFDPERIRPILRPKSFFARQ
jgi:hypothetical protein